MQTKQPVWEVRHAIEWEDGRKVYLSINGAPILDEDGEVSKVVFTVEDYTRRKIQQDDLEAALARERKLNKMKSEFISMVSHEFRTPMAVIMTSTGILRMGHHRMTDEQVLARLQKIEEQIGRLDQLVSDVTFINKSDIVGQQVDLENVNVPVFFRSIVEEIETAYPNHRPIDVIEEKECPILMLDPDLLRQIFANLLSNAMKYSADDDAVTLSYACDENRLTVLVSDEGIGIPEEDQRRLFEVFHRASNVGQITGSGLGLSITRRAVEALGGKITFESAEGAGTQFLVSLPTHHQ
jgi:signal transduction histidine kinase